MRGDWFHTGDMGVRSSDGSYRIVDRIKDMILRGGFNVYPREVEEVLYAHEGIIEAAVFGVPDESHGEEVKAVVVTAPGVELSAQDVIDYCKKNLAAYKYPRIVEFSEGLPKGPPGKILKKDLQSISKREGCRPVALWSGFGLEQVALSEQYSGD